MKLFLIVAGMVFLLVVSVVLIGLLLPTRHTASRHASYHGTSQQLFLLITGPQNWRPDVRHCETVADPSGRELMRETTANGETITYELQDKVPFTSVTRRIATENLPYSGAWTFTLEPDNEITIVRITENGEVYNPVFRFMSRFVFGHTRTIDAYLKALGQAVGQKVAIED